MEVLRAISARQQYSSAYFFSGLSGTGKTTAGRILAKAILCDSPEDGEPCGKCESCKLFEKEQHFGYIERDSASVGGKDDMIKLRDEAAFLSLSKKKIILLDECQDISKQGQDALLEQVESCPEHLIYIFCTTDPDKMKDALRGRCMQFQFFKVSPDLITQRIKYICDQEKFQYEEEALKLIASRADGHVRNAINLLEEIVYLGPISVKNVETVSKDFDSEIFTIIANLGTDLPKVIEAERTISSYLSASEFYNQLLAMINDTAKSFHGFDNFSPKRKELIAKLKDIHGHSMLEFLNYLITRDKFVDKAGLQSDLIIMHYKFGSNSFISKSPPPQKSEVLDTQNSIPTQTNTQPQAAPSLGYLELKKLSELERGKVLRESRRNQKPEQKQEAEKVPADWPLPKEERIGDSSLDEEDLSPHEFSKNLVGGRGGYRVANIRT